MKMVNPSAFIKGIRKQRKITQTELAEKSKVSQSNISKIENSLKGISLEDYEMILAALGFEIHIVERSDFFWSSCSGCFETIDGCPPEGSKYDAEKMCYLGSGCPECENTGTVKQYINDLCEFHDLGVELGTCTCLENI